MGPAVDVQVICISSVGIEVESVLAVAQGIGCELTDVMVIGLMRKVRETRWHLDWIKIDRAPSKWLSKGG